MQPPEQQCREFFELLLFQPVLDACQVGAPLVEEALQARHANLCRHPSLASRRERLKLLSDNALLHAHAARESSCPN